MNDFWQKQDPEKPLFENILWNKPERKTGKIVIIGGNKNGFAAVAKAYEVSRKMPVEEVKIVLPDSLKKTLPTNVFDATFAESNPSGSFAKNALPMLDAAASFANATILIGDSGVNAETSELFANFIRQNPGPITITRDAADALANSAEDILNRENIHLVLSISQLQKFSRNVYYPRAITLSMAAPQLAETLHKFTLTFPVSLTVWHAGQIFFAKNGDVFSQDFDQPMRVWSGEIAVRETVWTLWNERKDFAKNVVSSWTEL